MALVLNSNQIMSMACGKLPTEGFVQLFGDRDFSSTKAISEKLNGSDIVDSLAALVCVVVQLELNESGSKFSVQPENGKLQILDIGGCSGWNGFVALLKTNPAPFVNVTFGEPTKVDDTDLDQPNFIKAGLIDTNNVQLAQLGSRNFLLYDSDSKKVGYVIICEAGESAIAISSIKSATKTIINRSAPAAKIKKLSDINPRVLAKTVADILTKIDTESKDSPNRQAVLIGAASNLAKDVREMSAALSNDPNSEFFGKSSQQIASIVTAKFLPQFGKEFAAIPNELSLKIDEALRSFKETVSKVSTLKESDTKNKIIDQLKAQANDLASCLNDASLFLNVNEAAILQYGFKTENGTIKFLPNNTQQEFNDIRPNAPFAIPAVFVYAAYALVAAAVITQLVLYISQNSLTIKRLLTQFELADAEQTKASECTKDSNSEACKDATAKVAGLKANIASLDGSINQIENDTLLGSLANKLQEFSNSLSPMLKVIGWTVAGAVAVVAAKKIYNAFKED